MKQGVCHIVGAGSFSPDSFCPRAGDSVIAADGGYAYLEKLGVRPDIVLGDFDSLGFVPQHDDLRQHPVMKDDTDMMLAVKTGMEQGFDTFVLHGGLGGRLDHTMANIQTLVWLSRRGCRGYLVGEGSVITAITDGSITLDGNHNGIISVFCMGDRAEGVTLEGLLYPLDKGTLTCEMPLGVSNEFTGVPAWIGVEHGTLLLIWRQTGSFTVPEREREDV